MKPRAEEPSGPDQAVARMLDQIELEDPPADIKDNVLRAIAKAPEPARAGWIETFRSGLRGLFFPQAFSFVAGAAAGVVVFALASGSGPWRSAGSGPSDGAMSPYGPWKTSDGGSGTPVDEQRFELGRANVQFEVFRSGDRADIVVHTVAAAPVVVTIQAPAGLGRVERLATVPSAAGGAEYGPSWVRIRQSGHDQASIGLVLDPGATEAPIRITINSPEGTIQGALRASAAPVAEGSK